MTMKELSKSRPLWATILAFGCLIVSIGMLGITFGLVTGAAIATLAGSAIVSLGLMVGFFGAYVFFLNRQRP